MTGLFVDADIISVYTRAEAIEDGVLVDMSQGWWGDMAREAGIRYPIAMTRTAFDRYVDLTDAAKAAHNDERGRWWDVLWMFRCATRSNSGGSELRFRLHCVVDEADLKRIASGQPPGLYELKAVCGPNDDLSPCITFMLPEED